MDTNELVAFMIKSFATLNKVVDGILPVMFSCEPSVTLINLEEMFTPGVL